jgi:uncharacterized SAM-binding protein YcdF (DUF218 family)
MAPQPTRWLNLFRDLRPDGLLTFSLSNLILVASAGLSGLVGLAWSYRIARRAPATATGMDAILVPGQRLGALGLPADFLLRLGRAEQLHHAGAGVPIVLLGGKTRSDAPSEARTAMTYLRDRGVAEEGLILEEVSVNTLENLRAARDLARRNGWTRVTIVSNRYHLARIGLLANGLGLDHDVCAAEDPADLATVNIPRLTLEAYYAHWYVVGRLWATLTRNRESLERIT